MADNQKTQSGFALLISLIVVGAVLSIGLAILDLSIKQVRLAATTKDSEIAFHAANAGMECARYWRRAAGATLEVGNPTPGVECFGTAVSGSVSDTGQATMSGSSDGEAYVYRYEFTWNSNQSCSSITKVIAVADLTGNGVVITNMRTLLPGFPETSLSCGESSQCTAISAQGYNRPCAQKASFGTIQREVLLEF